VSIAAATATTAHIHLSAEAGMTVSSMATGCDVSESDVTGSDVTGIDVIRPKVGDCPWGVILIVRGVVILPVMT
jgi:hypothetical protein